MSEFLRQRLLSPSLTRYYAYALTHSFEEAEEDYQLPIVQPPPGNAQLWEEQESRRWRQAEQDFVTIEVESTAALLELFVVGRNVAVQLCMSPIIPIVVVPANIFLFFTLLLQNTSVFTKQSYLSVAVCIFTLTMVLVSVDAEIMNQYKGLLSSVADANFKEMFASFIRLGKSVMLFEKGAVIMSLVGDLFGLRIILTDARWGYIPWKMYIARGLQRFIHHLMCDLEFNWIVYSCNFITIMIGVRSWYDACKIQAESHNKETQSEQEAKEK